MQMRTSSRLPIRAALKRYDNMRQRTEDDFCGCGGKQRDNVHQMQEHLPMCLTVMRQRQSAAFEDQSLQATDRQAKHVESPLCGTKSLCHHGLIWRPQTPIGLLAKHGSLADGSGLELWKSLLATQTRQLKR